MAILDNKVVLVTGASKRLGRAVIQKLHAEGAQVVVHYYQSDNKAKQLADQLNQVRENSAIALKIDLSIVNNSALLVEQVINKWGRLDVLVNNASRFYPSLLSESTEQQWEDLMDTNLKAPFFLSQACFPFLKKNKGCIINMVDVYAYRPLKNHSIYSIAKAGLKMLTESLALELGQSVRVNGIAPGIILWPENTTNPQTLEEKACLIEKTALKSEGSPSDIAAAVFFLIAYAPYTTGHIIPIDGGRLLNQ